MNSISIFLLLSLIISIVYEHDTFDIDECLQRQLTHSKNQSTQKLDKIKGELSKMNYTTNSN
jgi:hypothetical protein